MNICIPDICTNLYAADSFKKIQKTIKWVDKQFIDGFIFCYMLLIILLVVCRMHTEFLVKSIKRFISLLMQII